MKHTKQSLASWLMHAALAVALVLIFNEIVLGFVS